MRHQNKKGKLSLKAAPRKALLRSLATSLVLKEKIKTTLIRAKTVKSKVEKYVTVSKAGDLTARRQLLRYFYGEKAVNKLLTELGPKYKTRPGGYTRIVKLDKRKGDNAPMAIIEFV
ncbi:MAG: 50S ribosomal protein L17 [Parcubacteria group bacterium GW2011_GWC2_38_7]|nr:MAG: 50S ribosomal protein L17 [Parcubacteria group bacterium GW2011_GWC2_38_7]